MSSHILGIDIGSVSMSLAELDCNRVLVKTAYAFHKGDIPGCLSEQLKSFDFSNIGHVAKTSSTPRTICAHAIYDNQVSVISTAKERHLDFNAILHVGGEKFGLLCFDHSGQYLSYKTNTSCAAGTGSFLDQQAGRLNLGDIFHLSRVAHENKGTFPMIASRCAVFAKTDLIHAQQEGYSIGEISEGLCYGLAKNIVDTLFSGEINTQGPVIFCGGVSKNPAVKIHIESLTGLDLIVDDASNLYGAIGAALCLADDLNSGFLHPQAPLGPKDLITKGENTKELYYPPLTLELSQFPDFQSLEKYCHTPQVVNTGSNDVETDVYQDLGFRKTLKAWLGMDIGSTSTKAVLTDEHGEVISGFYTQTAGNPLQAVCAIFETMDDLFARKNIRLDILACGTTGSGRKFIGKIMGSDLVLDEITAHARAAVMLNPDVDTIIEIGGQDAKFTTLKNGMVTSSFMNNVCAAGTGSFIEEQARKLNCTIRDYAERTLGVRAPMASDRCTVFMERDLNHYLTEGYSVDEVLASVLHSVRENYLIKVATESQIGNTIFFQGATAKNKALVAAFEQRLKKPILVSRFCHLTGALGTALTLIDEYREKSHFRGLDLFRKTIPIRSEVCSLCTNHCKISIADIEGEQVAYGFLCGRDYETKSYICRSGSSFDLIKERRKIQSHPIAEPLSESSCDHVIGIPAAVHLFEDLPYWKRFFDLLSIKTVTSEGYKDAVKRGKSMSETEFCAPVTAMYGHVDYLMDRADYIFLPYYLENKEKNTRRQYCYYTQYIPTIMAKYNREKILTPLLKYLYTSFHTKIELYKMLKRIGVTSNFFDIAAAYDKAFEFKDHCTASFKDIYTQKIAEDQDISVVFLGRPYTILSPSVNSGIPGIFSSLGINTFYQDMVPHFEEDTRPMDPLLNDLHWNYPAAILKAAEKIAKTNHVYPVFVTSFKCSPDAFALIYFKELMAQHDKPYLILELDEHDSSVGYETRIEAAIRAFRNKSRLHSEKKAVHYASLFFNPVKDIADKNLVIPNWDPITCRLLAATLKRDGIKAYLIDEKPSTILKSMKFNSGQCIPANSVAQGFIETIDKHGLAPEETILWLSKSNICNLKLYPNYITTILESYGKGMEKAGIYHGQLTYIDISIRASINAYFAHMFGGMIRKMGCKIRPYERVKGTTDRVIEKSIEILEDAFLGNRSKEEAISQVVSRFEWIETKKEARPKVAIFGDIYVRDNTVMNQDLIHFIEDNGGEVITTPYTEMGKMVASMYFRKWFNEGLFFSIVSVKALVATMKLMEKKYGRYFERIIREPEHLYDDDPKEILARFNLIGDNTGESMENILKIHYLSRHYPDISLFVQASPAFCCPSIVTEAMKQEIERITQVPVVSITYDGTGGIKNQSVIPYLKFPRNQARHHYQRWQHK
ncbi:MAG: CoA activase [Proteobacteria bacterium]|nr:CoA activase [Pseudomonadota bacterium]